MALLQSASVSVKLMGEDTSAASLARRETQRRRSMIDIKLRPEMNMVADGEKPGAHVSMDVEIADIAIGNHQYSLLGFIRFCIPADHKKTGQILVKNNTTKVITPLCNVAPGWNYDIEVFDHAGCFVPVNPKFMFYNSSSETIIYSDVFIERDQKGHSKAVLNYRFQATMMQEFDLSYFPFDRQYLGLKINTRIQYYNFCHFEEEAKVLVPPKMSYFLSPFTCRMSFSLPAYEQIAVFADLAPPDNGGKVGEAPKPGKPLYYCVVERNSYYHYRTFVIPMSLTSFSAVTILLDDPFSDFANRISLIISLFIALVGLKFVLINSLPEGEQETILDETMRYMFMILFTINMETVLIAYILYDTFTIELMFNGEIRKVYILDAIMMLFVIIFAFLLQVQFLFSRSRLSSIFADLLLCRWSRTRSKASVCAAIDSCLNKFENRCARVDPCSSIRPHREIFRPWIDRDEMPDQLAKVQLQFFGREAVGKTTAVKSDDVDTMKKAVYEGFKDPEEGL